MTCGPGSARGRAPVKSARHDRIALVSARRSVTVPNAQTSVSNRVKTDAPFSANRNLFATTGENLNNLYRLIVQTMPRTRA